MPDINRYQIRVYGSPDGIDRKRAQVYMFSNESKSDPNQVAGFINFYDAAPFPADSLASDGKVIMNLPTTLLASVVDLLRNEKPISFGFYEGHAHLHSAHELVGEDE